ncbi:hypothetical protein [Streptomyces sp. Rer75]|uniref:hypothetical protein n=1 Tax=Streptomyces sp. Rer75 TaxID=2750011 RepID=UPI0015D01D3E|nr:hypothetical protein [Streptomyces sp. Rer75]QLH19256.1 hypothetical protein HYQ63_08230 [Streptomyces sp. Rer75]
MVSEHTPHVPSRPVRRTSSTTARTTTAQSFAIALRGADGRDGPFYSVDAKGEKPQFSWNEADVLNWSTTKLYDF